MIKLTASKEDTELIMAIVLKAEHMGILNSDRMTSLMDITACHANGTQLRLKDLLNASKGDFVHDISGISAYLNRETGQLKNCFLPRYAR